MRRFSHQRIGDRLVGPHLPVRVPAARAHGGAAVLEDGHRVDVWQSSEAVILVRPGIDEATNVAHRHVPHAEVVPRRVADDTADARLAARLQQIVIDGSGGALRTQRREVIVEYKGRLVMWIHAAIGTGIARTQVAARLVAGQRARRSGLDLSLPWAGGALG